jgi:hypothetical protein
MLPRIIGLIVLVVAIFSVASAIKRLQSRAEQRRKNTYRPREDSAQSRDAAAAKSNQTTASRNTVRDATEVALVSRREAQKLRDALTGLPIDTQQRVWQCSHCQSLYHETSVQALQQDSGGKCIQCQSTDRNLVAFSEP